MTHHTRQSALGLPYIVEKEYGGKKYSVSEYTMSEILASVYDEMERSGRKTGILFLDEINCVSETLAPSMLQFLQYKTFGRHRVPEGWIVVTAGNPAEYNDSVRSVLSYLSIKPQYFYRVSTTIDGKSFVTARSWDDLSRMISVYEENGLEVDRHLISQYVQDEQIASDYANYYDLYRKYQSDYQVEQIIDGTVSEDIVKRASGAKFDERLSLISLVLSSLEDQISETLRYEESMKEILAEVKGKDAPYHAFMNERASFWNAKSMETDTRAKVDKALCTKKIYEELAKVLEGSDTKETLKKELQSRLNSFREMNQKAQSSLDHTFRFMEKAFAAGQEMLILVSELTIRPDIAEYIYAHGCEKYFEYNDKLLFEDQKSTLNKRIEDLNLLSMEEI